MKELRKIEKLMEVHIGVPPHKLGIVCQWAEVKMNQLEIGDIFRMFESDGEPVDNGESWKATSKPYYLDDLGVWCVQCEALVSKVSSENREEI